MLAHQLLATLLTLNVIVECKVMTDWTLNSPPNGYVTGCGGDEIKRALASLETTMDPSYSTTCREQLKFYDSLGVQGENLIKTRGFTQAVIGPGTNFGLFFDKDRKGCFDYGILASTLIGKVINFTNYDVIWGYKDSNELAGMSANTGRSYRVKMLWSELKFKFWIKRTCIKRDCPKFFGLNTCKNNAVASVILVSEWNDPTSLWKYCCT